MNNKFIQFRAKENAFIKYLKRCNAEYMLELF